MAVTARRIIDHPIIDQGMSPVIGDNINGPTLIRVPDWVQRPLGRYYLYFAHHEGRSIRLAYADSIFGPWSIYEPGALALENSLFPSTQDMIEPDGGSDPFAALGTIDYVPHIASPDVLIDPANRRFLMYFHGMTENGDQMTRLAISADGLNFHAQAPLLRSPTSQQTGKLRSRERSCAPNSLGKAWICRLRHRVRDWLSTPSTHYATPVFSVIMTVRFSCCTAVPVSKRSALLN